MTSMVRLWASRSYGARVMSMGAAAPMMITSTDPRGARGDWTNGVHQRFIESAPPPVLPEYQRQTEELSLAGTYPLIKCEGTAKQYGTFAGPADACRGNAGIA